MFLVTTDPAPISEFFPIVMPTIIVAFAPIDAPHSILVLNKLNLCLDLGYKSLVKETFGPI
jgi:hypothetical protein